MSDSRDPKSSVLTSPSPRLPTGEERRRTQRVMITMPVLVHVAGKPPIKGMTQNVSAGGAMVVLPEPLPANSQVIIEHPKTQEQIKARVVRPPQFAAGGANVAFEFSVPSPTFWGISFPPPANNS